MSQRASLPIAERLYEFVFEEEEARACEAIPEEACREAPRNFFLNVTNGSASKLAEQLVSPGVTLPWMLNALGAPVFYSGLLVPLRNGLALLPQLAISARIRSLPVRKHAWVVSAMVQAASIVGMLLAVAFLRGAPAGILIAAMVAVFSLASGVASVSFKDVVAKTIPKGKRGRLLGVRGTIGGALTLAAAFVLYLGVGGAEQITPYVALLAAGTVLWLVAAAAFARIDEQPGATQGGRNALDEIREARTALGEDRNLTRFVVERILLLAVPFLQPFYVVIALSATGERIGGLALFVAATGLANVLSSHIWGLFSDRDSRSVMSIAAALGAVTGAYVLGMSFLPDAAQSSLLYMPALFFNGVAQGGTRLGRKTYLVDYAPDDKRALYVGVSNSIVGVFTLAGAAFGALAQVASVDAAVAVLVAALIAAALLARRLTPTGATAG
jgi:sugar phosphate permease